MPPLPHVAAALTTTLPLPTVVVEVLLISADQDGLRFRATSAPLRDEHPDVVARSLAELPPGRSDGLLHSTSWRFAGRSLTVTYVALPDPSPGAPTTQIAPTPVLNSGDPLAPSPAEIRPVDVAVHACRHLAFLRQTDPTVAAVAAPSGAGAPLIWRFISEFTPAVAGALAPNATSVLARTG
ncbi:hypothetical protein [Micromonospora sp. RTGN7]|uniref:hypothetical protein n=1 Tax=Micromonospora sp. RTGN7 TaxID=3016526 RepID=UPI0029FF144A|nr:hypothetical protein [Micromonospora sp. RTGN7]